MVGRTGEFAYNPLIIMTHHEDIPMHDPQPTEPEENATPAGLPAAVPWLMHQAAAAQSAALPAPASIPPMSALAPGLSEAALAARERRVSDALRGNDRLTEGLPLEAAESLLELGLDLARRVVRDTAGLDDSAAEDVLQPRVRAVRRLMMGVSQATGPAMDAAGLSQWLEQAAVALGDHFRRPDNADEQEIHREWEALAGKPADQIAALRRFIERFTSPLT